MNKETKKPAATPPKEKKDIEKKETFSSKIEEEGEKLITFIFEQLGKYIPEDRRKTITDLRAQSRKFLSQLTHSVEESHKKATERIKVEAKKDREAMNSRFEEIANHWRTNINDQINKGLARLDIVTRKDIEPLFADLKKLRKEINSLRKAEMPVKKAGPRKAAEA